MNIRMSMCGLLTLLLPNCGRAPEGTLEKVLTIPNSQPAPSPYIQLSQEEKARFYDISFPIAVEPYKIDLAEKCTVIGYFSTEPLEKLIEYHTAEMEYWGWERRMLCKASESCITFKKPSKECVIIFKETARGREAVLFIEHGS